MAKNISLLGADYPDVPAVKLPQTGGGTAVFYDTDDMIKTTDETILNAQSVSANTDKEGEYGLTAINNYLPIGIISTKISGPYSSRYWIYKMEADISSKKILYGIRGTEASSALTLTARVLWVREDAI